MHQNEIEFAAAIAALMAGVFFVIAILIFNRRGASMASDDWVSGAKLITPKEFNRRSRMIIRQQPSQNLAETDQADTASGGKDENRN